MIRRKNRPMNGRLAAHMNPFKRGEMGDDPNGNVEKKLAVGARDDYGRRRGLAGGFSFSFGFGFGSSGSFGSFGGSTAGQDGART